MGVYKVLKDFPSRNGVKQYKAGTSIQLYDNSRTKALVEMGAIAKTAKGPTSLTCDIVRAISNIPKIGDRSVAVATIDRNADFFPFIPKTGYSYYVVEIAEGAC